MSDTRSLFALFRSWEGRRQSRYAWQTSLHADADTERTLRAVGAAVLTRADTSRVARDLIEAGEFDAVDWLIDDVAWTPEIRANIDEERRAAIDRARSEISTRVELLRTRAEAVDVAVDADAILEWADRSRDQARAVFESAMKTVQRAEERSRSSLRRRLKEAARRIPPSPSRARWQEGVERSIHLGAFKIARETLDAGPDASGMSPFELPQRPPALRASTTVEDILGWYHDPFSPRPGKLELTLDDDDDHARDLLTAVGELLVGENERNRRRVAVLVTQILGGRVLTVLDSPSSATILIDGLSTPGLEALAARRWPEGMPLTLTSPGAQPDYTLTGLGVRLVRPQDKPGSGDWLELRLLDVLAVLSDRDHRSARLLRILGPQIPLTAAFADLPRDSLVEWSKRKLRTGESVLYVAAPGMGAASLRAHLAAQMGAQYIEAADLEDIDPPSEPCVLVLEVPPELDARGLRRFVRELYYLTDTCTELGVAATALPEAAYFINQLAPGQFELDRIQPCPTETLRNNAVVTLGWIGVEAADPALYDRIAMLASGNHTVLWYVCRALVTQLSDEERSFDRNHLDRAWHDGALRADIRSLLWTPLSAAPARLRLLRLIAEFVPVGSRAEHFADLVEMLDEEEPDWSIGESWQRDLQVLQHYGLVTFTQHSTDGLIVSLQPGGLTELVGQWLHETREAKLG